MRRTLAVICLKCHELLTKSLGNDTFYCEKCQIIYEDRTRTALGKYIDSSTKQTP